MRFITEFELEPPRNYEAVVTRYKWEGKIKLGSLIEESFGWDEKGVTTLVGPVKERYTLEIEAFPMDKWVEFKMRLSTACAYNHNFSHIEKLIKELESFGKPSGDAITNQK